MAMKTKTKRLGFDVGSGSLKIAVFRGGKVRIEEVPIPEDLMEEMGSSGLPHGFVPFLRKAKKELSLPGGPAALALPPSQALCRLVTMPRMSLEQLKLNLAYEFSDFIQGEMDQYYYDYAVCEAGEEEEEVPMMAAVAAKQTLTEYAQVFSQAGFRLKTVLPQEMALLQLCQARGGGEEFCFVDLGRQFTRIIVVSRDRIQATRQIALGVRDLDGAVSSVPYPPAEPLPAASEVCDRIAVEILKVIHFYQFTYRSSALSGVCLVGGGAGIPLLRQSIGSTLGLPLLDPAELLPETDGKAAAGVFAAGAAMGGN